MRMLLSKFKSSRYEPTNVTKDDEEKMGHIVHEISEKAHKLDANKNNSMESGVSTGSKWGKVRVTFKNLIC